MEDPILAARACEMQGDTLAAKKLYRALLLQAPESPVANANLGYLILLQGNSAGAIASLQRALEVVPGAIPHELFFPSFDAGALPRAALGQVDDRMGMACLMVGLKLQELGRFEDAKACFERSIEFSPTSGAGYYSLVNSKRVASTDEPLMTKMRELLASQGLSVPDRGQLLFALGKALDDLGDYGEAMSCFDEAHRLASTLLTSQFDPVDFANFIGAVIGLCPADQIRRRAQTGSPSELPLPIVGMMRSGTTLVEQILSSHREIAPGEEMMFWKENFTRFLRPGGTLPNTQQSSEIIESYLALLRTIGPTALRVTDKMPQNFAGLGMIHMLFPNARIICCRRNPVDTALSIYMTSFRHAMPFVHSRAHIVAFYKQFERLMNYWRDVLPENRLLEVSYEGLIGARESTTRQMVEFVGLDWDDACLSPEANKRTVKTASVWQARQPVYATSTEKWRRYEPWLGEFAELMS